MGCYIYIGFFKSTMEDYILEGKKKTLKLECKEKCQQSFHFPTLLVAKCSEGRTVKCSVSLTVRFNSLAQNGRKIQRGWRLKPHKVLPHEKIWTRKSYLALSYIQRDVFQIIKKKSEKKKKRRNLTKVIILYCLRIQAFSSVISFLFLLFNLHHLNVYLNMQ